MNRIEARLRSTGVAMLALAALSSFSCGGPLYSVSGGAKKSKLPGIPFITRHIVETCSYYTDQKYLELHLSVVSRSGGDTLRTAFPIRYSEDWRYAGDLGSRFASAESAERAYDIVKPAMDTLSPEPPKEIPWNSLDLSTMARHCERKAEPSTELYYINVDRAAAGSSEGEISLGEDGTLTSAKAKVEDKALETLLPTLPIEAYLSKSLKLGSPKDATDSKLHLTGIQGRILTAEFTVRPVIRRYTMTTASVLTDTTGVVVLHKESADIVSREVAIITADATPKADAKDESKEEAEGISIKGAVTVKKPGEKRE